MVKKTPKLDPLQTLATVTMAFIGDVLPKLSPVDSERVKRALSTGERVMVAVAACQAGVDVVLELSEAGEWHPLYTVSARTPGRTEAVSSLPRTRPRSIV